MTINRRKILALLVSMLFIVDLSFMLVPFVLSLTPTDAAKSAGILTVDIKEIPLDSYRIYEWKGTPVAIFRPGPDSKEYLIRLNSIANGDDYQKENFPKFFAYEHLSTYKGCVLWDASKDGYAFFRYKGWFDPCHLGFWDYSGRYIPGVNAPLDVILPGLKKVTSYHWVSDSVIEFRP